MNHQLESLRLLYHELVLPLKERLAEDHPDQYSQKDEDPIWHLGHAANDLCRALLEPFSWSEDPVNRFGTVFLGPGSWEPWPKGERPALDSIFDWYKAIFLSIEKIQPRHAKGLSQPFFADQWKIETTGQAWDYCLFHTGLHVGRVHEMLGW